MVKATERAGWRKSKSRPAATTPKQFGGRGRERRKLLFKVSLLATFAVALAIVLSIELLQRPDRDVPLVLAMVSSSTPPAIGEPLPAPPNPFAAEDAALLNAWFSGEAGSPSENVRIAGPIEQATGAMGYQTAALLGAVTGPLAEAEPGGPGGDMLAVFISAHGFVHRGTPYLAVGDSQAERPETWIPFQELYDAIASTIAEREDGDRLRLVLFLDTARAGRMWYWGQFSDGFVEACERFVATGAERIAVVHAAESGQRSLWDPRRGHGLFTAALIEALTGQGDLDGDSVVTVGEIADYLRAQVNQTAEANWDRRQSPRLIGSQAADWAFISQPVDQPKPQLPAVDIAQLRQDFEQADALWERHNRLADRIHRPLATDPVGWAVLEKKLARLDALALAGRGYRESFQALRTSCESDLARFENAAESGPPKSTLPELPLRDFFHGVPSPSPELSAAIEQWNKKPEIDAFQVPLDIDAATRFLWGWLSQQQFDRESIRLASDFLQRKRLLPDDRAAPLIESFLVQLFSAPDTDHVSAELIGSIVESQRSSRDVLLAGDLRAAFWIRGNLDQLNRQRMGCIDEMLARDARARASGQDRWLRQIRGPLQELAETARRLSDAYRLRDEMLHGVPRIAETLMHDVDAFEAQEQIPDTQSRVVFRKATEALSSLVETLQLPRDDDRRGQATFLAAIDRAAENAEKAYSALRQRITDRQNEAFGTKAEDARALRQNVALLTGSGSDNRDDRRRIHAKICELLADSGSGASTVRDAAATATDQADLERSLALQSIDGLHVWQYFRQTAATAPSAPPEQDSDRQADTRASGLADRFARAGDAFLAESTRLIAGELGSDLAAADVLAMPLEHAKQGSTLASTRRELEAWDTFLRSQTVSMRHAAAGVRSIGRGRFALDQQLFLLDHADRTLDEFWCQARGGDLPFQVDAATDLLTARLTDSLFSELPAMLDGVSLADRVAETRAATQAPGTLAPEPTEEHRGGTLLKFVAGKDVSFVIPQSKVLPAGFASLWAHNGDDAKVVSLVAGAPRPIVAPIRVPETLPDSADRLTAGLFFRGLRRSGDLPLGRLQGGRGSLFTLPNYSSPAVRVTRDSTEPQRLILVMDCSLSMANDAPAGGLSRLDVAKNAVRQFVANLPADVHLGLVVFGDRYGFEEKRDPQSGKTFVVTKGSQLHVLSRDGLRTKDAGWIEADAPVPHNPNFDVRVGVPINPLDARQAQTLTREINALGPVGTTPTYRAIAKAYQQLGDRSGHVIVLTDGKPMVIAPEDVVVADSRAEALAVAESRRQNVRMTIVKYLNADTKLQKDFPRATVLTAANGNDLLRHLQSVQSKPEVVWLRRREESSQRGDFGALLSIGEWPPGDGVPPGHPVLPAEPYSVRASIPDASPPVSAISNVRVEGGEEFDLVLSEGELRHRPFEYEFTGLQMLPTGGSDGNRFRVHAGATDRRNNRQVTLQLAVESGSGGRASGRFTPRPSDAWIEVVGIDSRRQTRGGGERYSFSLPEFQTAQPIPILLCRIDNFPAQYDQAEIRAWLRFADQRLPGVSVPLRTPTPFRSEQLSGVSFRIVESETTGGGVRLTITEQYSDGRSVHSIRMLSDPLPDRARTTVYEDKNVVVRTLEFDRADAQVTLAACDRESIIDNSSLTAQGTIVIDLDSR